MSPPPQVSRAQRRNLIELRRGFVADCVLRHLTYEQTVVELRERHDLSVSVGTVGSDIVAVKTAWRNNAAALYGEHVARSMAMLDRISDVLMDRVLAGDGDAIDRMLKVEVRRAKLLGLDAPVRSETRIQVTSWRLRTDEELRDRIAATKALEAPAPNGHGNGAG